MTYGLSTRARIEDGPMAQGAEGGRPALDRQVLASARRSRRLALIERALNPANDRIDGFPLAL